MFGLLFLNVLTAWKTSTQRCCRNISHTILTLQKTPLRPPPFLKRRSQDTGEESRRREEERKRKEKDRCLCYSVFHHLMATYHCCWKLSSNLFVFLTGSVPPSVPLLRRTPPATSPPDEPVWGRSVWMWACPGTLANPGTGTVGPYGTRPVAAEQTHKPYFKHTIYQTYTQNKPNTCISNTP